MTDSHPSVAILIDTATSWGRRMIRGITDYAHSHGPWHLIVTARGLAESQHLPLGWNGDGVIGRVHSNELAEDLAA